MLPIIARPAITWRQKRAALMVAGAVDLLQIALLPALGLGYVLDDVLDVIAAAVLVGVCGFRWQFAAAFGLELLPIVDIFPTWTAVVMTLQVEPVAAVKARPPEPAVRREIVDVEQVLVPPIQGKELKKGRGDSFA
jgi:hypothetical protein